MGGMRARPVPNLPAAEWIGGGAVLLGLVLLYALVPDVREIVAALWNALRSGDPRELRALVDGFGVWGPLTLLALGLAQVVLAVIPALPVMVASVLAYGPVWGSGLAWGVFLIASAFGYGIGRFLGVRAAGRFVKPQTMKAVRVIVERYGLWGIAVARLSPLLPTDAVSIAAGLAGLGFRKFMLGTAIGSLPLIALLVFVGAHTARLLWVLGALGVLSMAAFAVYVWRDRAGQRSNPAP